jgi:3-oxocholest-4-en-26-oate---CoA ligase
VFLRKDGLRWVLLGDMATVDEDGVVTVLGRGSQCINTGGEKVYPEEVEQALKSHPDVYDALVAGVPDTTWTTMSLR